MNVNAKKLTKMHSSSTPFDDTFRTEIVRMKEWLIPLINEAYGTAIDEDAEVVLHENEQMILTSIDADDLEQQGIPRKITDTTVTIGNCSYHLECQSGEDGTILIRIVEYDLYIAVRTAEYDEESEGVIVEIPQSVIVFLRRSRDSSKMRVTYRCGSQEMSVDIPTISAQKYSLKEMFEKRLFFLIPYYFMRYEDIFNKGIGLEDEQIRMDIELLCQRLYDLCQTGKIPEVYVRDLMELTQTVLKQITQKLSEEERERIVKMMGGRVLEMSSDKILEEGRQEGRQEGRFSLMLELIRDNILTISEASRRLNVSEDVIARQLNQ